MHQQPGLHPAEHRAGDQAQNDEYRGLHRIGREPLPCQQRHGDQHEQAGVQGRLDPAGQNAQQRGFRPYRRTHPRLVQLEARPEMAEKQQDCKRPQGKQRPVAQRIGSAPHIE